MAARDPWAGTSAVSPDQRTAYSRVPYSTPSEEMTVRQQEALLAAVEQARSSGPGGHRYRPGRRGIDADHR